MVIQPEVTPSTTPQQETTPSTTQETTPSTSYTTALSTQVTATATVFMLLCVAIHVGLCDFRVAMPQAITSRKDLPIFEDVLCLKIHYA